MENGRRLGFLITCPVCYRAVDPLVIARYDAVRHIPARTVVKCPAECKAVWYIPNYKIEELSADTA